MIDGVRIKTLHKRQDEIGFYAHAHEIWWKPLLNQNALEESPWKN